jgi:hypothetical protein
MAKVLYIAGWGRSGTTIVDNVLNSYESVFSTGELFYLWQRGMVHHRRCGCGVMFARCDLWGEVLDEAFGTRPPDPCRVIALQEQAVRVRHTPGLLHGELSAPAREYLDIYRRLYRAIADVTGARLIVDSSKLPSGAALLTRMHDVEPYLLHMVRDPRAVTHSWMGGAPAKKRVRTRLKPSTSTAHWLIRNVLAEWLAHAYPGRHRRLRYEDFAADPRPVIEAVLAMTGMPYQPGPFLDGTTVQLRLNHTIAGNPSRFRNGRVAVEPDDRWRDQQQLGPRLTSTALALPLLHRYRYRTLP